MYMVPPPKTYADFNFTGIYSEFYILAPILFRLNLRHQQWENWKTEKLNSIGEVWGPFFSCGIQFFSFSVLGFSWKVKTRKAEKTEKLKNWKTEFHRRSLGSILLLWNSVFQFFSSRLLLKGENPKSWKNWKNQVTPSCVNNLEYEHLTPRSIEATDYNRIGRLRQGKNK